jgi:malonate-semialdehyde dehydrogenase (acetylating)/methylmalonate-semialdehyde dehydrogenase
MVPDVDVGAGARVRQHVHAQAVGEGSVGVALHRELLKEAGVPDGVFNVVHGGQGRGRRAARASRHQRDLVRRLDADREVRVRDATRPASGCQALGGAKNHMIVLPDADIDMAPTRRLGGVRLRGERCMAVSQVVAVGDVADPLVEAIKQRIPNVKLGDGMDASSEMGPLITREHRDKVASYIGRDDGATVVADGRESCPTATASSSARHSSTTSRRT